MNDSEKPHILIKNNPQKGGYKFSDFLTEEILLDIVQQTTECNEFTYSFDDSGYNKGRLAVIHFQGNTIYVSFSETGRISARNSFFQSLSTALVQYYADVNPNKSIYFYFLPLVGRIETNYFIFMYRLMATAQVVFLNADKFLENKIYPFTTIEDINNARDKNRIRNKSNNSTYLTTNSDNRIQIYGKTYGASKKETTLFCIAVSNIAQTEIELYQINEQNLNTLPKPDLEVIRALGNIKVIVTDLTMERRQFEENDSLRSPRYIYNLFEKLGDKECAFCGCKISQLIAGAHIWPVADIKRRSNLAQELKLEYALDGDNGIWLCENHHKLFDTDLLSINEKGELRYKSNIEKMAEEFIKRTTTLNQINREILTPKFLQYLENRNELIEEWSYNLLNS